MAVSKTLLCIEDDREAAKLIAEEMIDRGFNVLIANDGHEGFAAILKGIPDAVLCDIGLPYMSGLELLDHLKRLCPHVRLMPFIFVTALCDPEHKLQARQLGAKDYVTKPIDFDVLEVIIRARLASVANNVTWPKLAQLSDHEAQLLAWVARGKSPKQIAEMLAMPIQVVASDLDRARFKIGAINQGPSPGLLDIPTDREAAHVDPEKYPMIARD